MVSVLSILALHLISTTSTPDLAVELTLLALAVNQRLLPVTSGRLEQQLNSRIRGSTGWADKLTAPTAFASNRTVIRSGTNRPSVHPTVCALVCPVHAHMFFCARAHFVCKRLRSCTGCSFLRARCEFAHLKTKTMKRKGKSPWCAQAFVTWRFFCCFFCRRVQSKMERWRLCNRYKMCRRTRTVVRQQRRHDNEA